MNQSVPAAEIFSQGDEIVTGQTVDTNAAWLAEHLVQAGFDVTRHTAVGDQLGALVAILREISERADCCICTGGLGPTSDDLTAEAVSLAFDRPLVRDSEAVRQIEAHFQRAGRRMPQVNLKQALIPEGSMRIDNEWGTAPGFSLRRGRCRFAFLPGVPFEMKNMFQKTVLPELTRRWHLAPLRLITLRCAGIGESSIQERLESVQIPADVRLSFRTGPLENQIKLIFPSEASPVEAEALVEKVKQAVGSPVFAIDGLGRSSGDLVEVIAAHLSTHHQCLSVLETVSSGRIAARCRGANWFKESRVIRERERAFEDLAIPVPIVSDQESSLKAAAALATAVADRSGAGFALAQLWSFDARALDDMQAAIPVYTALATPTGIRQYACLLTGTAPRKQTVAATRALDLLRRYLQECL